MKIPIFIFVLVLVLGFFYMWTNFMSENNFDNDNFDNSESSYYPYNPEIHTPVSNYNKIANDVREQDKYKPEISVAQGPTPTIKCNELDGKDKCNQYGCNWFGTYCSSIYPSYL